ncbi:MAG: SspB family protein [Alphaproteobacteria bacterium]
MARDTLQYDKMVETALRGVVREALRFAAKTGLPGNHHFYLTFRTDHPGVEMSDGLRAQYPNDMTVVLQHQYWGLEANDDHFVVNLSFSNVPERLKVPYAAMMSFVDPSVKFGLQFQPLEPDAPGALAGGFTAAAAASDSAKAPKAKAEAKPAEPKGEPIKLPAAAKDETKDAKTKDKDKPAPKPAAGEEDPPADAAETGEKVVSLDAFRKK